MKQLMLGISLGLLSVGSAYANFEYVGHTQGCPFSAHVMKVDKKVYVEHEGEVHELRRSGVEGDYRTGDRWPGYGFTATIRKKEMAIPSRLTMHLSGVRHECDVF